LIYVWWIGGVKCAQLVLVLQFCNSAILQVEVVIVVVVVVVVSSVTSANKHTSLLILGLLNLDLDLN